MLHNSMLHNRMLHNSMLHNSMLHNITVSTVRSSGQLPWEVLLVHVSSSDRPGLCSGFISISISMEEQLPSSTR